MENKTLNFYTEWEINYYALGLMQVKRLFSVAPLFQRCHNSSGVIYQNPRTEPNVNLIIEYCK